DRALSANWLEICRRIVIQQKELFGESSTVAERDDYEGVGEGGDNTLVLDRKCEDIVFAELEALADEEGVSFTAISEERGTVEFNGGGDSWVVIDPIDGSLNVKRTLPNHSLSIAVASAPNMAAVEFGYVYDFGPDEEYWAQSGGGAYLDERQLKVTEAEQLELVGIEGASPQAIVPLLERLTEKVYRLRCVGSLAITVSYIAANRLDGMVTPHPSRSVDVAAAQLIAREAGAFVALGEDGLASVGFDLDERFSVTAANSPSGLETLLSSRG
ncbi:MAG: inositol monophosphatase family protein, partial [Solirubrobacterales bacterium]